MTEDKARRMAEEVELPEIDEEDCWFLHNSNQNSAAVIEFIKSYTREAIAAALVKLTQGQEPVAYVDDDLALSPTIKGVFELKPRMELFAGPIPRQQEELLELQARNQELAVQVGQQEERVRELEKAVGVVLEGWTLPDGVRKTLETAFYSARNKEQGK